MESDLKLIKRLERPQRKIDVVLDTDTYNEIDDQFSLSYLLRSPEEIALKAVNAAPFFNSRSSGPADGMEKSYGEICKILTLAEQTDMIPNVYRGSKAYLSDERTPVISPAAEHLAALAAKYTPDEPLYVVSIAAITNVASALLIDPGIKDRIVIVWLGGHAQHWPDNKEFNLRQDVAAARVVFGCGAAVVQLPCAGVVDRLTTTEHELRYWLRGKNPLATYLCDNTIEEANSYAAGKPWSRVIWDIAPVAWLLDREGKVVKDRLIPSPVCEYDHLLAVDPTRHPIRYAWHIDRDAVFGDMFKRLSKAY